MRTLQQYDQGVLLSVPVREADGATSDLVGDDSAWVHLQSPSGRRKKRSASVDATADTVDYLTQDLDLDEWGVWRVQAEIKAASYHLRTSVALLDVRPNLDAPQLVLTPDPAVFQLWSPAATLADSIMLPQVQGDSLGSDVTYDPDTLTADFDYTGGDWQRVDTDTSWAVLPAAYVQSPRLQNVGVIEWDISGLYGKGTTASETLELELLANGAQVGGSVSFTDTTVTSGLGKLVVRARLRVVHDAGSGPSFDLEVELGVRAADGTTVFKATKTCAPTIDPTIDNLLRFRIRKSAVVDDNFFIRSVAARWVVRRGGA